MAAFPVLLLHISNIKGTQVSMLQRIPLFSVKYLKIICTGLTIVACVASIGVQMNRWIIRSRTVTQSRIAEGWKASGVELAEHTIERKDNFWKVARK
jgi:hypothetical protein